MNARTEAVNHRAKVDKGKFKQQSFRISTTLHRHFKMRAAKEGKSMSEIVEALILTYLRSESFRKSVNGIKE